MKIQILSPISHNQRSEDLATFGPNFVPPYVYDTEAEPGSAAYMDPATAQWFLTEVKHAVKVFEAPPAPPSPPAPSVSKKAWQPPADKPVEGAAPKTSS